MRALAELVDTVEPGITFVHDLLTDATRPVEILACDSADGERTLLALQVTTRSPMGALAYETGGILVDDGWIRVLGSPCARLPRGIAEWNRVSGEARLPGALLVGDDAVGGFFAVNHGGLRGPSGNVFYLSPDSLAWEDLGAGYSGWLSWLCSGDVDSFYESMRWPTWQDEVRQLPTNRAFSMYPFLFADGPPVAERSRRPVPVEELWGLHANEIPEQLTYPDRRND
jgi:hypothetical protein